MDVWWQKRKCTTFYCHTCKLKQTKINEGISHSLNTCKESQLELRNYTCKEAIKRGRRVRLTTSPPSMSRSRRCLKTLFASIACCKVSVSFFHMENRLGHWIITSPPPPPVGWLGPNHDIKLRLRHRRLLPNSQFIICYVFNQPTPCNLYEYNTSVLKYNTICCCLMWFRYQRLGNVQSNFHKF
jgi:hypothetical protein